MIAFIDDHRGVHGVEPICRVLPIAPSTYHAHQAVRRDPGKASARAQRDAVLCEQIRRVYVTTCNYPATGSQSSERRAQFDCSRDSSPGSQSLQLGSFAMRPGSQSSPPCPRSLQLTAAWKMAGEISFSGSSP
jgi:hypothetical protein